MGNNEAGVPKSCLYVGPLSALMLQMVNRGVKAVGHVLDKAGKKKTIKEPKFTHLSGRCQMSKSRNIGVFAHMS